MTPNQGRPHRDDTHDAFRLDPHYKLPRRIFWFAVPVLDVTPGPCEGTFASVVNCRRIALFDPPSIEFN